MEAWAALASDLRSSHAGFANIVAEVRHDNPEEDLDEWTAQLSAMLDKLQWLVTVAQAMRSRSELLAFYVIHDHPTMITIFCNDKHHVSAITSSHFIADHITSNGYGRYEAASIGEGNAQQTADCVVIFSRDLMRGE